MLQIPSAWTLIRVAWGDFGAIHHPVKIRDLRLTRSSKFYYALSPTRLLKYSTHPRDPSIQIWIFHFIFSWMGVWSSESALKIAHNGVFNFDFGQVLFFGDLLAVVLHLMSFFGGVRVIYMYLVQAAGQFWINSKSRNIKLSFKGLKGCEWLQKMRSSRYSPYGFVLSDFDADQFISHRL